MKRLIQRSSAILLSSAIALTACNSNFDLDFTSDNHPLLEAAPDNYSQTKYPIVLVHGLYGFDDIFGLEYWYDIPFILENGGSEVYVATASGANTPQVRGAQLISQLELFQVQSGMNRFHLIGHSLGGPTIRYAAGERPDLVVSATSVSGVNQGSQAADNDLFDPPLVRGIIAVIGNLLGHTIDLVSQESFEQNILASLDAMASEGIAEFNTAYPKGLPSTYCNGAETDSVNGFSHGINGPFAESDALNSFTNFSDYYHNALSLPNASGPYEIADTSGAFHDVYFYSFGGNRAETNTKDPLEGLHRAVSELIDGDDDDGFVERCSFHHGWVIKDNYPMNHLDVMNWFIGLRDDAAPYAPSMYRAHAHFLQQLEIQQNL